MERQEPLRPFGSLRLTAAAGEVAFEDPFDVVAASGGRAAATAIGTVVAKCAISGRCLALDWRRQTDHLFRDDRTLS